jgi:hypothetical protein
LVQHVHKEWPATAVRPGKSGRGNFDMVVLDPAAVSKATTIEFEQGRVAPAVVIEVGLNYGEVHVRDDMAKLENSRPPRAYLVHLARNPVFHLPAVVNELIDRRGRRSLPRWQDCQLRHSDYCEPRRNSHPQPSGLRRAACRDRGSAVRIPARLFRPPNNDRANVGSRLGGVHSRASVA